MKQTTNMTLYEFLKGMHDVASRINEIYAKGYADGLQLSLDTLTIEAAEVMV